jgi:hypothetical protein
VIVPDPETGQIVRLFHDSEYAYRNVIRRLLAYR